MSQQIAVSVKYQPPGAAQPTESLLASTRENIDLALAALAGQAPVQKEPVMLPPDGAAFVSLLVGLFDKVQELRAELEKRGNLHELGSIDPREKILWPSIQLSTLRAYGSGPKQVAQLLSCEAGYFDQGHETICVFSPLRFSPVPGFFDLRVA